MARLLVGSYGEVLLPPGALGKASFHLRGLGNVLALAREAETKCCDRRPVKYRLHPHRDLYCSAVIGNEELEHTASLTFL
jgi:hypothetical protein